MKSMELTDQEARLIRLIREIDNVNPVGSGGFSTAGYMSAFLRIMEGGVQSAAEHYRNSLKEFKDDKVIDLTKFRGSRA